MGLLSIPKAAERLGVSRYYIYDRINDGTLPVVQLASDTKSKKRVSEEDLDAFIARRHSTGRHLRAVNEPKKEDMNP